MSSNLLERDVTITNIVKGFENAKSTMRVKIGSKPTGSGGTSPIFASVTVPSKLMTVDEMIEHVSKLPKVAVKLPTVGADDDVQVRVQGTMSGARIACIASFRNRSVKPSVCTLQQYIDHLEACGIPATPENLFPNVLPTEPANEPTETVSNVPNVGNRESAIETASQANPRKRQPA